MTNKASTSFNPPHTNSHSTNPPPILYVWSLRTPIQPSYTRNFSFPSGLSLLQLTAPSLGERQVPFRSRPGSCCFYGKYCDPASSLRGISTYEGRWRRWFDLLFFHRLSSSSHQTHGPSHPGKPRHKSNSSRRWGSHRLAGRDEDTWVDGRPLVMLVRVNFMSQLLSAAEDKSAYVIIRIPHSATKLLQLFFEKYIFAQL